MTKTPHVHAALIKQWADGAIIEVAIPKNYDSDCRRQFDAWMETKNPEWNPQKQYRVKPEPKPDVVMYAMIEAMPEFGHAKIRSVNANVHKIKSDTCMFIFDGETGVLKAAQVLARV